MKIIKAILSILIFLPLMACIGESDNEKVEINAYFYFPNDKEIFLGRYTGISACQSAASSYAYSKNLSDANWGYICCTIEKGSSCYRKIK